MDSSVSRRVAYFLHSNKPLGVSKAIREAIGLFKRNRFF